MSDDHYAANIPPPGFLDFCARAGMACGDEDHKPYCEMAAGQCQHAVGKNTVNPTRGLWLETRGHSPEYTNPLFNIDYQDDNDANENGDKFSEDDLVTFIMPNGHDQTFVREEIITFWEEPISVMVEWNESKPQADSEFYYRLPDNTLVDSGARNAVIAGSKYIRLFDGGKKFIGNPAGFTGSQHSHEIMASVFISNLPPSSNHFNYARDGPMWKHRLEPDVFPLGWNEPEVFSEDDDDFPEDDDFVFSRPIFTLADPKLYGIPELEVPNVIEFLNRVDTGTGLYRPSTFTVLIIFNARKYIIRAHTLTDPELLEVLDSTQIVAGAQFLARDRKYRAFPSGSIDVITDKFVEITNISFQNETELTIAQRTLEWLRKIMIEMPQTKVFVDSVFEFRDWFGSHLEFPLAILNIFPNRSFRISIQLQDPPGVVGLYVDPRTNLEVDMIFINDGTSTIDLENVHINDLKDSNWVNARSLIAQRGLHRAREVFSVMKSYVDSSQRTPETDREMVAKFVNYTATTIGPMTYVKIVDISFIL